MQAEFDHQFVDPLDPTGGDAAARRWTIVGEFSEPGPWTVSVLNNLKQTIGTLQVTR